MEEERDPPRTNVSPLRIFLVVGLVVIAALVAFTMRDRQRMRETEANKEASLAELYPPPAAPKPSNPSKVPDYQVLSVKESKTPAAAPPNGQPIALDESTGNLWLIASGNVLHRWNPRTGETVTLQMADNYLLRDRRLRPAATPDGIYFSNGSAYELLAAGKTVTTAPSAVHRYERSLFALRDHSVLAFGGDETRNSQSSPEVRIVEHLIYRDGSLTVAPAPDLPGPPRRGTTLVQLADGKLMAIGGQADASGSAGEITDATWFLDLAAGGGWTEGPKLTIPRASASATLLPDGRILVAGGWVKGNDERRHDATRTTEIWDPNTNRFSEGPLLALGVAEHEAIWVPGESKSQLLLVSGRAGRENQTLQAYDVAHSLWRDVGAVQIGPPQDGEPVSIFVPDDNRSVLWVHSYAPESDGSWTKVMPRLPAETGGVVQKIDGELQLLRWGVASLPPRGDAPGIAVGGQVSGAESAAADLLWPDGRIEPLPVMRHERSGASVFRLQPNVFIVVNAPPVQPLPHAPPLPPPEWFRVDPASAPGHWQTIDLGEPDCAVWGPAPDASLVCAKADGEVDRVVIENLESGTPTVQHIALPRLKPARANDVGAPLRVKGLADGRIVVAGGGIEGRMARLTEASLKNDVPDEYVPISRVVARSYETYDPTTKRWRESALSHGEGSLVTILDDGRVVQAGLASRDVIVPFDPVVGGVDRVEISDANSWQDLSQTGLPRSLNYAVLYTSLAGNTSQLFIRVITDDKGRALLWLDPGTRKWSTLWTEKPPESAIGLILIRALPGIGRAVLPVPDM